MQDKDLLFPLSPDFPKFTPQFKKARLWNTEHSDKAN